MLTIITYFRQIIVIVLDLKKVFADSWVKLQYLSQFCLS